MDTTSLQSTLNEAREQFENGDAKTCVAMLKRILVYWNMEEPEMYRLSNDTSFLLARLNSLERERGMISEQNYLVEWNKLFKSTMDVLQDFEIAAVNMPTKRLDSNHKSITYKSELTFDLDYENTTLKEINFRLKNIENVLATNFLGIKERITGTLPGSVIVQVELYAVEIIKINSLVKLGLVDTALNFKAFDLAWNWMHNDDFIFQLDFCNLEKANLRGADLQCAQLGQVNLHSANLIKASLMGAKLINANLDNADFSDADLRSAELIRATLINTTLINANLRSANLVGADLSGANLSGADLRNATLSSADFIFLGVVRSADFRYQYLNAAYRDNANFREAKLNRTIFHEKHRWLLESMDVDISAVIFVDDDKTKLESWVEVE